MSPKIDLDELLGKPVTLYEKYHEKSKVNKILKYVEAKRDMPAYWKIVYFKGYPRLPELRLPLPKLSTNVSLKKTLYLRHSGRKYTKKPLSIEKISSLLYYSAGLRTNSQPFKANRFYPSAGAKYPLEVYFLSLNTELPKGLYHYYLKSHSLEKLDNLEKFKVNQYVIHKWFHKAPGFIIITAIFKRTTLMYDEKGYRYLLIEAGHLGQNISLLAAANNIACCAIEGFLENKFNQLLDIDGKDESTIYLFGVGEEE